MSSSFCLSCQDLITERLALRTWSTDEIVAVVGDGRAPRWAEDFPAEGDRVIAGVIAQQAGHEGAHRLIVERASHLVVGSISLLWPPTSGAVEVGFGVVPSRRGRNYAAEAARALVEFALTSPEVQTVYADVALSNPGSVRTLEKAGLRRRTSGATTARYDTTPRT